MSYSTYSEYLRHPVFLQSVAKALDRAGGVCEGCGLEARTEPHHVRYCPWGQFDPPENLKLLCRTCHEDAHRCVDCGRVALKSAHIKAKSQQCDACKAEARRAAP